MCYTGKVMTHANPPDVRRPPSIHGLDPTHVRDLIVRPVLALLALPSPAASERLLMGTAAQESRFRYLKQLGDGPALGLWQMEPFTFHDLWSRYALHHTIGRELQAFVLPGPSPVSQLTWNLHLACAMARVHYYARPFRMPQEPDPPVEVLARIWKEHYNTKLGKGREEEFVEAYRMLVAPIYAPR